MYVKELKRRRKSLKGKERKNKKDKNWEREKQKEREKSGKKREMAIDLSAVSSWQPQPGNSSFLFFFFFFVFPALYCDDPGCNITAQLSNICPCKQSAGQLTSSTRYLEFGARQLEPWYLKEAVSGTPVIHLYGGCYEGKETRGPWLSGCSA